MHELFPMMSPIGAGIEAGDQIELAPEAELLLFNTLDSYLRLGGVGVVGVRFADVEVLIAGDL